MTPPCMGGWCSLRDHCAHYTRIAADDVEPVERICVPKHDGLSDTYPVRITLGVGSWSRDPTAPAHPAGPFDGLIA